MGYAQSGLQEGLSWVTPQFLAISGTMGLQDLKAIGNDTSDNVYVQTLDAFGRTVTSYGWNDWAGDYPCWMNDDYEEVTSVTIVPGQGLCVQGLNNTQAIQSAGKIGTEDVIVTLQEGLTFTGNPFPVTINLQDIIAEGENTSDNVYIQSLDGFGRTVTSYGWNDWAGDYPCWMNDDYEEVTGVTIAPGQGLCIQGLDENQSVRFPAPEL